MQNNLEALKTLQSELEKSKLSSANLNKAIIQEIQNSLQTLSESLRAENEQRLNSIARDMTLRAKEAISETMNTIESETTQRQDQAYSKQIEALQSMKANYNSQVKKALGKNLAAQAFIFLIGLSAGIAIGLIFNLASFIQIIKG